MSGLALLLLAQVATSSSACALSTDSPDGPVWRVAATGLEALSRGDLDVAIACLESAHVARPDSAIYARDLALAYAQESRFDDARAMADKAVALGDSDPDLSVLRAIVLGQTGSSPEAIRLAEEAGTWEADLVGTALGSRKSEARAGGLAEELTERGALATLVLAARAGADGERSKARGLVRSAESSAESTQHPIILNAARDLRERLGGGAERFRGGTRLRAGFDYAINPGYEPLGEVQQQHAARLSLLAEGAVSFPIGIARIDASLRADQQVHLNDRELLSELDLTSFSAATSVEFSIGRGADAALIGLGVRYRDTFGDYFDVHYAYGVEGGPWLEFPFLPNLRVIVSVYGVAVDFVDTSPPDSEISSQNRDYFGQRAIAGLLIREDDFDLRFDAIFHRDNARGDAFDNRGAGFAGRARVRLPAGAVLRAGLAFAYRSFGPVGDEAIIGDAARRNETRMTAEIGAVLPLADHLDLVLEDVLVSNFARSPQSYTSNVMSSGLEVSW